MNATELPNLSLALKLAEGGLPVFPCTEAPGLAYDKEGNLKGEKAPYTSRGFKDATTDPARIQGWWAQWPGAVPGIPTGEASGLSVIDGDIDRDTGERVGEKQVSDLGLMHPDAVKVRTQSGGVQIIYRHVDGARTSSKTARDHIDTRGAGGYIIAPGARMQNGAAYRYEGRSLSKAIEAGDLPDYPVQAVQRAIAETRGAKLAEGFQIDTEGSYGQTEATPAETLEVVRTLLTEAPNTLCREDWVKLAVSLRAAYGDTLRDAFTSFSLGYNGGKPCTPQAAAHVWQSSNAAHTVTGIAPALTLLKTAVGQDRFKQVYRETFENTREQGSAETAPGQTGQPGQKPKTKFELIRADQLEIREPDYLVDRLIEAETLAMFFGDPGSGKSFAALDVACCVATGAAFHGRKVKRGAVIYICGEGKNGIKRRLVAWERHNGKTLTGQPLFVSRIPAQFLSPDSVKDVIEAIDAAAEAAGGEIALIMVDTLNRNMGAGDENSAKDMTAFISAVDGVKDRYGATALIVHHTGHGNKERARGSMSLLGALDAEYRVEKVGKTTITLTNTKMKDAPQPAPIAFDLVEVEVARSGRGEPITSGALTETDAPAKSPRRLTGKALIAMQAFGDALAAHGVTKIGQDFPANRQCVSLDHWREACDRHGLTDGESASAARQAFGRQWKGLQEQGFIRVLDKFAWRCGEA